MSKYCYVDQDFMDDLKKANPSWFRSEESYKGVLRRMLWNRKPKPKTPMLSATLKKLTDPKTGDLEFIEMVEEYSNWMVEIRLVKTDKT